jgi:hypothetical protein
MSTKKFAMAAVALVGALLIAVTASAVARAGPVSGDPNAPVVHRSTQDPADVQNYWTPERIRQAQENTRNNTSHLD